MARTNKSDSQRHVVVIRDTAKVFRRENEAFRTSTAPVSGKWLDMLSAKPPRDTFKKS